MDEYGRQTGMPRAALPRDSAHSESIVWGVGYALAGLFAVGQIVTVLAAAPAAIALGAEQAGARAGFIGLLAALGPTGLLLMLAAIDVAVFALLVYLARRHWVGFIFLAPVLYLGIGTVLLWPMFLQLITWAAERG